MTALGAAVMRAVHTRLAPLPLIDDPWGERLVTEADRKVLREAAMRGLGPEARLRFEELRSTDEVLAALARRHPHYGTIILRMRYAEDALAEAVGRGARQYVIVGAGMDSFALRRPRFAEAVEVFEVDHPATQGLKLRRLRERGLQPADAVHYVASDLSLEDLDTALARSPFDRAAMTFFSWLGVTAYLTREVNLRTLRAVASCGARDSELVFSYVDQRALDAQDEQRRRVREVFVALGEPWVSGFHPSELPADLRSVGLTLIEDLGRQELHERYCSDRTDGLSASVGAHVARARVGG